jgi:hypothetical protein
MSENTWQELLVQKYPQLFIRSFRGLPFSPGYPLSPDGWREIVTNVADRVSEAARGYSVYFCQISERYGRLRIYWNAESALPRRVERAIEEAIALAEARSSCSCEACGAEGRLFASGGLLLTACAAHARGEPVPTRLRLENVHLGRQFVGEEIDAVKCRRYDRRLDAFVDVDAGTLMVDEQS